MIAAFLRFYFKRDVKSWRALRRACRAVLPAIDQKVEP
jgi:hypothetical protein